MIKSGQRWVLNTRMRSRRRLIHKFVQELTWLVVVLVVSVLVVDDLLRMVLGLDVQPDLDDVTDDIDDGHQQELELQERLRGHQQHLDLLLDQQSHDDQLQDGLLDRLLHLLLVSSGCKHTYTLL